MSEEKCEMCGYVYPPSANGSHQCAEVLLDSHDLMVDEFMRIAACPAANSEIKDLCARAISYTKRRVPLLTEIEALRNREHLVRWRVERWANSEITAEDAMGKIQRDLPAPIPDNQEKP